MRSSATPKSPDLLSSRLALRPGEVAKLIGCSPATVRGMIARGELPGRRVGSGEKSATFVVPVEGLKSWLAGESKGTP